MADFRPTIAITMGDPAGVGPEIVVKTLADAELRAKARFVIYGLNEQLTYAADLAELDAFWWRDAYSGRQRRYGQDVVAIDYDQFGMLAGGVRGPSREGGKASVRFCLDAIAAAKAGLVDAVVTAPIAKRSWHMAGYNYPGHTELFAEKTSSRDFAMMFAGGPLRVALATTHVGINGLWGQLRIGNIYRPIDLMHRALVDWFDVPEPRIAVCGLNPHAGENGAFGDEEERLIEPAMQMARNNGINVQGPFPADTIFLRALRGEFDAVVAMYHDQGLIPVKLVGSGKSVNLTLGLPIVRTSPDHGTAFDIAGRNAADASSMRSAVMMAIDLATRRSRKELPVTSV
ncbi:MAG: 4-hydroxythreonine-4-phosphate dehydrogenase PdxA [Planctomycetota bacterium]